MKISGFTMGKDITKLYYPVKESIMSILPICDEFIVALGKGDENDTTREIIESIGSDKIKIIDTIWDIQKYPNGTELAHQTDIAKSYCTGDWLFYIQADEVIHEKYLGEIKSKCQQYLDNSNVEGFLFKYTHFWGDYDHVVDYHSWYKHEIRIIRNLPDIHSWRDAQSFRRIPDFDGKNYRQIENTFKLKVIALDVQVYHYGWVRPPRYMKTKSVIFDGLFTGKKKEVEGVFDYGPLSMYNRFKGTHPLVMQNWISKFDWKGELQYTGKISPHRKKYRHERLKYRIITFLERHVFFRPMWEFKNYIKITK